MAVGDKKVGGLEGSRIVVGCHIGELGVALLLVVAVDQHHRNLLGHLENALGCVGAWGHDDAVDVAGHQRIERAVFVERILACVDYHHGISEFVGLLDYDARDVGEKRVFDTRNQQRDSMGGRAAQTLRNMIGVVIQLLNRIIHNGLRSL